MSTTAVDLEAERRTAARRNRTLAWRAFRRNRLSVVGAVIMLLVALAALLAPVISPYDPLIQDVVNKLEPPSAEHWLGTDEFGRDVLSRLIHGAQISLLVGIISVAIGAIVGSFLGMMAGYFGGRIETFIMRVVDVLMAFPDLITGMIVLAVLGGGLGNMVIAIAITIVPQFARFAHAPTLGIQGAEFVQGAVVSGARDGWVLRRHIFPNIRGELIVLASLWTASAIRLEANLSFIGLGVSPPTPTWGQMIRDGLVDLSTNPQLALAPGLALLVTVLGFNLIGDGVRDSLDPRTRSKR